MLCVSNIRHYNNNNDNNNNNNNNNNNSNNNNNNNISQGTKDHLIVDKFILRNCKRRHTNLSMAWIDFKKAYDMVPHSWIIGSLRMFGIADNVVELLSESMNNWRTTIFSGGKQLGTVEIKRGYSKEMHFHHCSLLLH